MAAAPDSIIVTGGVFQQVPVDQLLVTPTGGSQTTLAQALANGGGGGGQWSAGAVDALGPGVSIVSETLEVTQNWAAPAVSSVGAGVSVTSGALGVTRLSAAGVTANATLGSLPANAFILYALFRETAGATVSVGIGSTSGQTDALGAVQLFGSTTLNLTSQAFAEGWFSASSAQTLFLSSANWNGASVNVTLVYIVGP